ncbi:hypothetical protein EcWSU1_A049 (plasmid) [Enterobacter ludwigii]|uniref:Uncharacterized protein n=1 Tax=Enterobacter ludwigii TaxID=299767 RepID=G8LQC7_9ENTR|nr:hypothetical protein EcWSU1_A049 [Enterobacter ludwigii]
MCLTKNKVCFRSDKGNVSHNRPNPKKLDENVCQK